jgi:hypothetical protein
MAWRQNYLKLLLVLTIVALILPSVALAATFSPKDVKFRTGESKTVNLTDPAYSSFKLETNENLIGCEAFETTHIMTTLNDCNVTFSVQPGYADWVGYEKVTLEVKTNLGNYSKTIGVLVTEQTDDGKLIFIDGPDYEDITGDDDELVPGDSIEVTFEVKNAFTTTMDINNIKVKAWLQDSSGKKVTDTEETEKFDLGNGERQDGSFKLTVPIDTKESTLYLYVRAEGKDDNDEEHSVLYIAPLKITKNENDIAFASITTIPDPAICGQSLDINIDIWNVGTKDQNVTLRVTAPNLGIDVRSDPFTLDNTGDDREAVKTMSVLINNNIKPGSYMLTVTANYNKGKTSESETKTINLICPSYVENKSVENQSTQYTQYTQSGALTFSTTTIEGKQGEQSKIIATLKNTGTSSAVYTFELSGIKDWASGFVEPDTISLAAGASTDIFVYLTPKTSATGTNTATVTVKSGGAVIESKTLTINLPEKPTISITSLDLGAGVDSTTAALIIVAILIVIALIVIGKKKANATLIETYGDERAKHRRD